MTDNRLLPEYPAIARRITTEHWGRRTAWPVGTGPSTPPATTHPMPENSAAGLQRFADAQEAPGGGQAPDGGIVAAAAETRFAAQTARVGGGPPGVSCASSAWTGAATAAPYPGVQSCSVDTPSSATGSTADLVDDSTADSLDRQIEAMERLTAALRERAAGRDARQAPGWTGLAAAIGAFRV